LKLAKSYFALATAKTQLLLRLSKAKDSYFGVSEATLLETVFEMQNNYNNNQTSVVFRLFREPK